MPTSTIDVNPSVALLDELSDALPATLPASLPAGLTEEDLTRVAAVAEESCAASTRMVYAHQWRRFTRWCTNREIPALPADPAAVALYLVERIEDGLTAATLDLACSAIRDAHLAADLPTPTDDPTVRRVRAGLRRLHGVAPRRQARALSVDELGQILARIDRTGPIGARDAAILLLGYAGALRR